MANRTDNKPGYRDDEPPQGPWGSFPLTQIAVLVGLVLLVVGMVESNVTWLAVGLLFGSAGGLELSIREHFAGYRSHTTLLSGVILVVATALSYFVAGLVLWLSLAIGVAFFAVAFWLFRLAFRSVSGGLTYRVR